VVLNAGLLHRVGPHRWHVHLARALAALGMPALRFDRSGVGDSPVRRDADRFERTAVEDTRAAMGWLAERHGCRRFALMGMCAGAELAFKTACHDERVGALALINAPRYLDEPDEEFLVRIKRRVKARRRLQLAVARPSWRRLVIGWDDGAALLRSVARRLGGHAVAPPEGDVTHIRGMLERDVRFLLLLSEGEWTHEYARMVFGTAVDRRRAAPGRVRLEAVADADHTLSTIASRQRALAVITGWARDFLDGDAAPAASRPAS
jgi:pimeloyl-ACP methyl ester carboxylesterase